MTPPEDLGFDFGGGGPGDPGVRGGRMRRGSTSGRRSMSHRMQQGSTGGVGRGTVGAEQLGGVTLSAGWGGVGLEVRWASRVRGGGGRVR